MRVDTKKPTVLTITSSNADGVFKAGDKLSFEVTFDEIVEVTGEPSLQLNFNSKAAIYKSGNKTDTLVFECTLESGDNSPKVDASAININNGTIKDLAGNAMDDKPTGS